MMLYLLCIVIGIGIGQAYRAARTRQAQRALQSSEALRKTAYDMNDRLSGELLKYRRRIANIKAIACRIHVDRIQSLGGAALLPAPADRAGERISNYAHSTGPSSGYDGPNF